MGAVAKAVQSAADEGGKAAGGLVTRVFGPAADEIGAALRRYTAYRVGNVERIAEAADRKSGGREGVVPPRLAHSLLEDGSWCDDELMAEYLGGVLASGRTPTGRDDRGVTWTKLITSMSSIQIRAHFILYREWAKAFRGSTNSDLPSDPSLATMYIDLLALIAALLEGHPDVEPDTVIDHVIGGLARLNLIGPTWMTGRTAKLGSDTPPDLPFSHAARLRPTHAGLELFGWACGRPGHGFVEFMASPEAIEFDTTIPRPAVALPKLSPAPA